MVTSAAKIADITNEPSAGGYLRKGVFMIKYIEKNVNPKGRKTGDCSTRALVGTLRIEYDEALKLQTEVALKTYYDPTSKQVMEKVLAKFGYVKMPQPRKSNGTKYTVGELDWLLTGKQMHDGVLVTVANHHTCITGGYVQDIWDCRYKTVGNYYVKR